jgi:hypothetical protein
VGRRWISGARGLSAVLRRGAQGLDGEPSAGDVNWRYGVADPPFVVQQAEDVENVVAIVGEGERVDDGVEADGEEGAGDEEG